MHGLKGALKMVEFFMRLQVQVHVFNSEISREPVSADLILLFVAGCSCKAHSCCYGEHLTFLVVWRAKALLT